MATEGPNSPGDDAGGRHRDRRDEPTYEGRYDDEVFEFDDIEFSALDTQVIDIGLDRSEAITQIEASEFVRRYLLPTEKFRGEWRRHWIQLTRRLTLGVLATFVLGYVSGFFARQEMSSALTVLVLIWIAVMAWVLWDVAEWYYDRFVLTNKRVMLIEGIIARRVAMMPLARVTDMKYTQSALGRVLGYGTFELESAGQEQALRNVKNLPNPTNLYLQVVEEMYEPEASEARRRSTSTSADDDGGY